VHLFCRRYSVPATPVVGSRFFPGAIDNYPRMPDDLRWLHAFRYFDAGSTPTTDAIERAVAFPQFHLHLGAPWTMVAERDGQVETVINGVTYRFDHVIAGTGYTGDLAARPELRDFASQILLWGDRYQPPADLRNEALAAYPYLGPGHELMEKTPGAAPLLRHLHVQNPAGFLSFGLPIGDVPSMRREIPVIVERISADLFDAEFDALRTRTLRDMPPAFPDTLYRAAVR
jgi:hypothetical protein